MSPQGFVVEDAALFAFRTVLVSKEDWVSSGGFASRLSKEHGIEKLLRAASRSGLFGEHGLSARTFPFDGPLKVELDGQPVQAAGLVLVDTSMVDRRFVVVGLDVRLPSLDVDETIALIQSALCPPERRLPDHPARLRGRIGDVPAGTLRKFVDVVVEAMEEASERPLYVGPSAIHCLELRAAQGYDRAADLLTAYPQACYGLLMGDEGWRYVPRERACAALGRPWSTRDYLAIVAQPASLLVVNLARRRDEDRTQSPAIVKTFAGLSLLHLQIGGSIAGLEHGGLFALLAALRREASAAALTKELACQRRQGVVSRRMPKGRQVQSERRKSESSLLLAKRIPELETLQAYVEEGLGLPPLLERLRRAAELADEQIRAEQALIVSVLVLVLTAATIVVPIVLHL